VRDMPTLSLGASRGAIVCAVLLVVFAQATLSGAQQGISKTLTPESLAELARLTDRVKTTGTVNVIVTLALPEPYTPETRSSEPAAIGRQRATIAQVRDALMKSLADTKASLYAKWDPLPIAALRVDAAALKLLGESSLITTIKEDRPSRPQ
jgi:hypothetical protein